MEATRWRRIEALLDAAFDLPAEQQRAFLAAECGDDAALRAEVESLLAADRVAEGVLEEGVAPALFSGLVERHAEATLAPGTPVGAYRVLRLLGSGGMGEVYLAERADGGFEQRVALKLIKRGMDTADVLRRFLAERRILARLEHPNIARLLDGGVGPDGRPYFAMEYVEGEPLTAWATARGLDLRARLRLFLDVAAAVEHAHRQLVVHRDLKPSNIMVRVDGRVALLDFGVAKLIEGDGGEGSTQTELGARALTPEYAAPEQVRGEPVSTTTDVYGLGAVLYHLLTGQPPLRLASRSGVEIERSVLSQAPTAPSARLKGTARDAGSDARDDARSALAGVSAGWIGDLDTIVLKALRKPAEERYGSAAAMADDIKRLLAGHPILARAPGRAYRLRRFIGRHRRMVALGALLGAAIVAGVATTVWQARAAMHEAERTARIRDFVLGLFEATDPESGGGRNVTVRELLDRGTARARAELVSQPDIQADVLFTVGRLYEQHGWFDAAAELAAQSLTLRRDAAPLPAVAEALHEVGVVAQWRKRYEEADRAYREALALRRATLGLEHVLTAQTESLLGRLELERNRVAAAEPLLRHALAVFERAGEAHAADAASVLNTLGRLEHGRQDFDAAERSFRASLTVRERLFGGRHPTVCESLVNLGVLAEARGQLEQAVSLYERVLPIRIESRGPDHASVGVVENNLGNLLMTLGRYDEAAEHLQRALEVKRASYGDDSPQLAVAWHNLARLALARGDFAAADTLSQRALDAATTMFGRDHPNVAAVLLVRAELALDRARLDLADTLTRETLAALSRAFGADHLRIAEARLLAARIALARGDTAAAERDAIDVLELRRKRLGEGDWRTGEALLRVAECADGAGRRAEAAALASQSLAVLHATLGAAHPLARRAALFARGDRAGARADARQRSSGD
jgi:serine/threonine-protein kinase